EPEHEPAVGRATLIQPPTISARTVGRVLGLAVALAAVVAAWFGVVRPELRDAARDAVDDRLAELELGGPTHEVTVPATVEPSEPSEPTTDDGPVVTETAGDPVAYRIVVDVGIGSSRSESITIPPDSRFHLTDVVPQNPNGDSGTA